jgi:hypothetical protein
MAVVLAALAPASVSLPPGILVELYDQRAAERPLRLVNQGAQGCITDCLSGK